MKEILEILVPGFVACLIAYLGFKTIFDQIKEKGLTSENLQGLGLITFLPTLLIISAVGMFESQGLAALLGAVAGYIFGKGSTRSG